MKRLHSLITILLLAISINTSYAEDVNEVTLTVSSDGPTKDDALKNALRSALEQVYGAFVSANTTILNDELVKEEIVTISNGSIKDYKELSCEPTKDGGQLVTLQATVSLPQLIKYARSKGSECEFAGNSFGMAMKLYEFQKENELKALYNLTAQAEALLPNVTWHEITVGEPFMPDRSEYERQFDTEYYRIFYSSPENDKSLRAHPLFLKMDVSKKGFWYYAGYVDKETESTVLSVVDNIEDYYAVPIGISWYSDGSFNRKVREVLKSISLSDEEAKIIQSRGLKTTELRIDNEGSRYPYFLLRNDNDSILKWALDFNSKIKDEFCNFVIVDNTGQKSTFYPREILEREFIRNYKNPDKTPVYPNEITDKTPLMISGINKEFEKGPYYGIFGEGLYHNLFEFQYGATEAGVMKYEDNVVVCPLLYYWYNPEHDRVYRGSKLRSDLIPYKEEELQDFFWVTTVLIPKSEIGKYSNFRVERAK